MKFHAAISDSISWIRQVIHSSARKGADAILFPECAVTGYNCDFTRISSSEVGAALQIIGSEARAARCYVLVGSPTFTEGKRFNSLVVFDPRGREIFRYSKIHLTPRDCRFFTPGNKLACFRLAGAARDARRERGKVFKVAESVIRYLTPDQKKDLIEELRRELLQSSRDLEVERAATLRDEIAKLESLSEPQRPARPQESR